MTGESKVKKVIVHRFSLAGGNLELELPGETSVAEIRETVFKEARARDEKKYKIDFEQKKVRLFLSHFELIEDNIDFLLENENLDNAASSPLQIRKEKVYESRYQSGKELYDAMTLYDLCDMLQQDPPHKASLLGLTSGHPSRPSSAQSSARRRNRSRSQSRALSPNRSPRSPGRTRTQPSPERVASRYSPKPSPRGGGAPVVPAPGGITNRISSPKPTPSSPGGVSQSQHNNYQQIKASPASSRGLKSPSTPGGRSSRHGAQHLMQGRNLNQYFEDAFEELTIAPMHLRKEKLSTVLLSDEVPLSANMLRIPPSHRDLVHSRAAGGRGDLYPEQSEDDPTKVSDDEDVEEEKKPVPKIKPGGDFIQLGHRRRVDEIHISAYVSVNWPLCMGEPSDVWKRRQKVFADFRAGMKGGGVLSKEMFQRLLKVDGFASTNAGIASMDYETSNSLQNTLLPPPMMSPFGGNLYLDKLQTPPRATGLTGLGPQGSFLQRQAFSEIKLNTTLGRTLFSAHSGATRIVNASRTVNPTVAMKRPKTPANYKNTDV
ncbi:unnamed protein product [Amoebophrya sp. A120]|nr:unnamed protein product [Amoebophrya sp. A120]|eukprot:GSA120T00019488001.1